MSERIPQRLALAFQNERTRLDDARARVREHLASNGVDERAVYATDLALEELGNNALAHGYAAGVRGEMEIVVDVRPRDVRVVLTDDAPEFDPTRHPEPARARTLRDAPPRGRGISMVRAGASAMRYRREGARNVIELDIARGRARA